MLFSHIIGYLFRDLSNDKEIRILYVLPFGMATLQIILQSIVYIHESPKLLMQSGELKKVFLY